MHSERWRRHNRQRSRRATACCAVPGPALVACSSEGNGTSAVGGSSTSGPTGGTKVAGATATWALQPSAAPNYIFPFTSSTYFSTVNAEEFHYPMYRPLYWFGNGASPINARIPRTSVKARAATRALEPELVDVDAGLPLVSPELDG